MPLLPPQKISNMQAKTKTTWRTVRLGDFASVNPPVRLERDKEYPFMDMTNVVPLSRTTNWLERKTFTGSGARFDEGDTLFARITPCLENGKITQVRGVGGPGFGSTEFYVLRGKEKISDNDFIFYLTRTYRIRKLAEASMLGASGRQRVERAAFENIDITIPEDIDEQKHIAEILSAFDDKIENNNRIIETLEQMAQVIFKEWFIDSAKIKNQKSKLIEIADIIMGQSPKSQHYNEHSEGLPFHQGVTNFGDRFPIHKVFSTVGEKKAKDGDLLFSVRAPVGRINIANTKIILGRGLAAIRHKQNKQSFLFYLLKRAFAKEDSIGSGSIFPAVTKKELEGLLVLLPNDKLADDFEQRVSPMDSEIKNMVEENKKLAAMRDLLLPRLM